jgi:hypothetical protein
MMMKKVLVLMLVLGIASMATAGLTLTVNGEAAEDSQILLNPSDYVMIGVNHDGGLPRLIGYVTITEGPGSWTGGYNVYSPPSLTSAYGYYLGPITGMGDVFLLMDADATINEIGIGLLADFEFHCDGPGEVLITLSDNLGQVLDTLIIHQIPEPMTIGLLGLGGLFLRRRK